MVADRPDAIEIREARGEEQIAIGAAAAVHPVRNGLAEITRRLAPRGESQLLRRAALLRRPVELSRKFEAKPVARVHRRGDCVQAREERLAIGETRDAHIELA